MKLVRDTWVLFTHYLQSTVRNPVWVTMALFQPTCYLFLYGPLLENMSHRSGCLPGDGLRLFLPGLLVMLALFSTMFVGFSVIDDLRSGVIERLRVTSVSRLSLLLGRTLRDVCMLSVQSTLLILLAIPLGLKVSLFGAAATIGIVLLIGLVMAPLSYSLALNLKDEDSLVPVINFFSQPMLLLSGILLPLIFAPQWLKNISAFNPLKYVVDAARAVFDGHFTDLAVFHGLAVLVVLVALSLWWGTRSFNKAVA